jgi:hypothetical protein
MPDTDNTQRRQSATQLSSWSLSNRIQTCLEPRPPAVLDSDSELHRFAVLENLRFQPLLNVDSLAEAEIAEVRRSRESARLLSSIYYVEIAGEGPTPALDERMLALAEKLRYCPGVVTAYVKPAAEPATLPPDGTSIGAGGGHPASSAATPPVTPDLSVLQGYLGPAPTGIDLAEARRYPGGDGLGTRIIDVEGAWRFSHEAVVPAAKGMLKNGLIYPSWREHGTAVLGLICGNGGSGRGIIGIAPSSEVEGSSIFRAPQGATRTATAILEAGLSLNEGDILLIELHRPGPRFTFTVPTGQGQRGFIPVEWWDDDQASINAVLARNVIVVATAGNGSEPLDDALYDSAALPLRFPPSRRNPFRRSPSDLGCVLVGAGAPPPNTNGMNHGPDRSRLVFSNWGEAVDAQGWGKEVVTSGYGDLQSGPDEDRWYTKEFCGTSSAAPMVAAVIACMQAILRSRGPRLLEPLEVRTLIRLWGSQQQPAPGRPATERIGPRPDLAKLIPAAIAVASHPPAIT